MTEVIFSPPRLFADERWSHITGPDIEKLHALVKKAGLKREWFQDKKGHPHYDTYSDRIRANLIRLGARLVTHAEYSRMNEQWHRNQTAI